MIVFRCLNLINLRESPDGLTNQLLTLSMHHSPCESKPSQNVTIGLVHDGKSLYWLILFFIRYLRSRKYIAIEWSYRYSLLVNKYVELVVKLLCQFQSYLLKLIWLSFVVRSTTLNKKKNKKQIMVQYIIHDIRQLRYFVWNFALLLLIIKYVICVSSWLKQWNNFRFVDLWKYDLTHQ